MTFYGREKEDATESPLRTFSYHTNTGRLVTVEAHYVQFMAGHVSFWTKGADGYDFLVLAEANTKVFNLKELP